MPINCQTALASAAVQAAKNSDGTPAFPNFSNTPIPFGSTINVTNPAPTAAGGKLAQAALAGFGGLGNWLGSDQHAEAQSAGCRHCGRKYRGACLATFTAGANHARGAAGPAGAGRDGAHHDPRHFELGAHTRWRTHHQRRRRTAWNRAQPAPDPVAQGQAMFVAAQQAFLAGQQAKAAAANDAAVGGSTVTNVNIVLDPDLSALYNTAGVEPAFQANIASLQCVRYLQSVQTTLGSDSGGGGSCSAGQSHACASADACIHFRASPVQPTIQTPSTPTP